MLDFIPQNKTKKFLPQGERDKFYIPDFSALAHVYKEFGVNNDIDLVVQKPQYKNIVEQRLQEIPISQAPSLDDQTLMDNMVSREYDVNELREIAVYNANEYKKSKN